jgi:hypothetical protein
MLKRALLIGVIVLVVIVIVALLRVGSNFGPGLADYSYKIAGDCTLDRASAYQITITCDGISKSIDPEVVQVGWNEHYLVATTHPVTETDPNNPNCTNCDPDENITYWWIQDLVNKQSYGPMSQEDFEMQEAKLGVPDIQLMSVDEAKTKGVWLYGDGRDSN